MYMQSWQLYEKEHRNESSLLFNTILTRPLSTLTQSRISGVYAVQADEHEIDSEEIK